MRPDIKDRLIRRLRRIAEPINNLKFTTEAASAQASEMAYEMSDEIERLIKDIDDDNL